MHCAPQVTDCTDTSQCPTGWLCSVVETPPRACGVAILPDGGIGEPMCEPAPPPTMQCMPPYADYIGRYYSVNDGSGSGSLTGALPPAGQIGGAPSPAPAPGTGTTNGETGGVPKSGSPGAAPSASSGDTGSCQIGHGGTSAGASLLALFGLMGLSRRRRSRVS
jgi:hypothetical protein